MSQKVYDLIIVGAGPAGLMAAIQSYKPSFKILILEKMPKPALKLRISGKGRGNITNSASLDEFISHFGKNGRFLKYSFSEFFNTDLIEFFERLGIQFKLERGGRYFSQNDKAVDLVNALLENVKSLNIQLLTNIDVSSISMNTKNTFSLEINRYFKSNRNNPKKTQLTTKKVIIATGGKSYPKTGSTGTGYKLASKLGHKINPVYPALVPLETKGNTSKKLEGLVLKNVNASVWCENKKIDEQFGEMIFTDFGISGPIILSLSKPVVELQNMNQQVIVSIDLKPALDNKKLDQRLLREINEHGKQNFLTLLKKLLPGKMIPLFSEKLETPGDKKLHQISSEERKKLRKLLKDFQFEVTGHRSFDEAIITAGGVSIKEINPKTMESKLVKGLFFAGEIIDIDADTGGYNLQAAFSTGWIAGNAVKSFL